MTDQPRPPQPDGSTHSASPLDRPLPPATNATRPQPDDWEETRTYSPVPEPRTDWSRRTWSEPTSSSPSWQPPTPRAEPVVVDRPRRRGSVAAPVVLASLLSAALATGGT